MFSLRLFSLALLLSLPSALVRAEAELLSPETVIAHPTADPSWRELFQTLSTPKNRVSRFEERRHFPFRDKPVVLTGEIRIVPERGLSLSYLTPKVQMVIVDEAGVLMRDDRGRERTAPPDSRAQAATAALFSILRFDVPTLLQQFEVHGLRSGTSWQLGFVPRSADLAKSMGNVIVGGDEQQLKRIDLNRSDKQRIEILIQSTMNGVIFPADVMRRFFR